MSNDVIASLLAKRDALMAEVVKLNTAIEVLGGEVGTNGQPERELRIQPAPEPEPVSRRAAGVPPEVQGVPRMRTWSPRNPMTKAIAHLLDNANRQFVIIGDIAETLLHHHIVNHTKLAMPQAVERAIRGWSRSEVVEYNTEGEVRFTLTGKAAYKLWLRKYHGGRADPILEEQRSEEPATS
jgi:hypothetical protein